MKIGLLTVYSFNYGSFYQAIALKLKLEEMGHQCDLVNERFKENTWFNIKLLYKFYRYIPSFFNEIISIFLPQYNTFLKLQKDVENYSQSPNSMLKMVDISKNYDCIILGSDELWSANPKSIRYTKEFFGYGIDCPHIAYAPSAALYDLNNNDLISKTKYGLESFTAISVRDEYTQHVVKMLINKYVPIVLDPTLLNPYFIDKKCSENAGYILVYGSEYSTIQVKFIKTMAKENNWKIFSLVWPQKWADKFINPTLADEFQNAFKYADFCFPSTFHGTIFSILHEKQFLSMTNELRGLKVKMLLKQLNLGGNIFEEKNKDIPTVDYRMVNQRLCQLREQSLDYLNYALDKVI